MGRFREIIEDISRATSGEELSVELVAPLLLEISTIYDELLADRDVVEAEVERLNEANINLQSSNHTLLMKATERDFSKADEEDEEDEEEIIDYDEVLEELGDEW